MTISRRSFLRMLGATAIVPVIAPLGDIPFESATIPLRKSVIVSWGGPVSNCDYKHTEVHRREDNGNFTRVYAGTGTSIKDDVEMGKTYTYRVRHRASTTLTSNAWSPWNDLET